MKSLFSLSYDSFLLYCQFYFLVAGLALFTLFYCWIPMPHIIWDFDWAPLNYIFQGEHNQLLYVELQFEGRYKILFIHKFLYRYVFAHFCKTLVQVSQFCFRYFCVGKCDHNCGFFYCESTGIYRNIHTFIQITKQVSACILNLELNTGRSID